MPTKGRPQVGARVSAELLEEMDQIIEEANLRRPDEAWTRATFIERAIAEKIAKMKRSRGNKAQRLPDRVELDNLGELRGVELRSAAGLVELRAPDQGDCEG